MAAGGAAKKPLSSLLKSVALPPLATAALTGLALTSIWSGIDATEISEQLSDASSSTLQVASSLTNADGERVEQAKVRAVQKARFATTALPTISVGSGTLLGCIASHKLADRFSFVRRYGLFRYSIPLVLGAGGTLGGAFVGMNLTVAVVISVGNKALMGIVLGEMGAPKWLVDFLIT